MSSVVISGDTSGTVTLAAPAVAGSTTLTLPSTSGTVVIGTTPSGTIVGTTDTQTLTNKTLGNTVVQASNAAPAFSAYQSLAQTLTSATWTKIQYQTKEFDTNTNYDNVTNYRFTPTVAGYYQVNGGFAVNVSATTITASFYKNGSRFKDIVNINTSAGAIYASTLIFLNGSTDYVELWGNIATGQALAASANQTYFQASFVRSA
jgi:hypothetical protein